MSVLVFVVFFMFIVLFMVYVYTQWRIKNYERYLGYMCVLKASRIFSNSHNQNDIYNISSTVQEQHHSNQDAYLSIDHITTSNQLNKPNYEDSPPSYEEAMRIAVARSSGSSDVPTVVVVPKTTN